MKALIQRVSLTASALALCALTACGSLNSAPSAPTPLNTAGIAQADANQISDILPTQSQISDAQKFNYLIANPMVEKFEPQQWFNSSRRASLWNADGRTDNASIIQNTTARCSAYEQVAPGLITTPSEVWLTRAIDRRAIQIGQSDIDQISGFSQVVITSSAKEAGELFSQIKNQTNSCSRSLKSLYPASADDYDIQSPSVDPQSGTATLNGFYRGQNFQLSVTHRDRYLIATWMKTDSSPSTDVKTPVDVIHSLAVSNSEAIPADKNTN